MKPGKRKDEGKVSFLLENTSIERVIDDGGRAEPEAGGRIPSMLVAGVVVVSSSSSSLASSSNGLPAHASHSPSTLALTSPAPFFPNQRPSVGYSSLCRSPSKATSPRAEPSRRPLRAPAGSDLLWPESATASFLPRPGTMLTAAQSTRRAFSPASSPRCL